MPICQYLIKTLQMQVFTSYPFRYHSPASISAWRLAPSWQRSIVSKIDPPPNCTFIGHFDHVSLFWLSIGWMHVFRSPNATSEFSESTRHKLCWRRMDMNYGPELWRYILNLTSRKQPSKWKYGNMEILNHRNYYRGIFATLLCTWHIISVEKKEKRTEEKKKERKGKQERISSLWTYWDIRRHLNSFPETTRHIFHVSLLFKKRSNSKTLANLEFYCRDSYPNIFKYT